MIGNFPKKFRIHQAANDPRDGTNFELVSHPAMTYKSHHVSR